MCMYLRVLGTLREVVTAQAFCRRHTTRQVHRRLQEERGRGKRPRGVWSVFVANIFALVFVLTFIPTWPGHPSVCVCVCAFGDPYFDRTLPSFDLSFLPRSLLFQCRHGHRDPLAELQADPNTPSLLPPNSPCRPGPATRPPSAPYPASIGETVCCYAIFPRIHFPPLSASEQI